MLDLAATEEEAIDHHLEGSAAQKLPTELKVTLAINLKLLEPDVLTKGFTRMLK